MLQKISYVLLSIWILFVFHSPWYAADNFDWSRIKEDSGYDYKNEEIFFKYSLNAVYALPESDYKMVFRIDNERYEKIFSYNASAWELQTEFRFMVEQWKAGWSYDIDYSIYESNSWENVRDKQYEAIFLESWKDIIDWSLWSFDIQEIPRENKIIAYFEVPYEYTPTQDYVLNVEYADLYFSKELNYDRVNKQLQGELEIILSDSYNPKEYPLNFEVRDDSNKVVSSETATFSFYVEPTSSENSEDQNDSNELTFNKKQSIQNILKAYVLKIQNRYVRTQNEVLHIQKVIDIFNNYTSDIPEHVTILKYAASVLEEILKREYAK